MSELKEHPPAARAAARALCTTLLEHIIEPVRRVARDDGYAIAVHGSLARDIDLVAIPWTPRAKAPEVLAEHLAAVIASQVGRCNRNTSGGKDGWDDKPHGRRAVILMCWSDLFGHVDIDLSVMTPQVSAQD